MIKIIFIFYFFISCAKGANRFIGFFKFKSSLPLIEKELEKYDIDIDKYIESFEVRKREAEHLKITLTKYLKGEIKEFPKDQSLRSPLHYAALLNDKETFKDLYNNKKEKYIIDIDGNSPLHYAAFFGYKDICEFIVGEVFKDSEKLKTFDLGLFTPLHIAVIEAQKEIVEYFVSNLKNIIDVKDKIGNTSLVLASSLKADESSKKDILNLLLTNKASLNKKNVEGNPAISYLFSGSDDNFLENFLKESKVEDIKEYLKILDDKGRNILMLSALKGKKQTFIYLAEKFKEALEHKDNKGRDIFYYVSMSGDLDLLTKDFIKNKENEEEKKEALISAANIGEVELLSKLLENTSDEIVVEIIVNLDCESNKINESVILLLNKLGDINKKSKNGLTPLIYFSLNDQKQIVKKMLKDKKLNLELTSKYQNNDYNALEFAILADNAEILKLLYKALISKAELSVEEREKKLKKYINLALQSRSEECKKFLESQEKLAKLRDLIKEEKEKESIDFLNENRINIDSRIEKGMTLLHYFSRSGNVNQVRICLSLDADINKLDSNHNTPLLSALQDDNFEVAKFLIDKKALINVPNSTKRTPLHKAVEKNSKDLVEKILNQEDLMIDSLTDKGRTALALACIANNSEIAKMLLDKGANPNLSGEGDSFPLRFSIEKNNIELVKYLIKNGAKLDIKIGNQALIDWAKDRETDKEILNILENPNKLNEKTTSTPEIKMVEISDQTKLTKTKSILETIFKDLRRTKISELFKQFNEIKDEELELLKGDKEILKKSKEGIEEYKDYFATLTDKDMTKDLLESYGVEEEEINMLGKMVEKFEKISEISNI